MSLIILILFSFSKFTIDWSSHKIEPRIATISLKEDKTFQICLLNKFENNLSEGKLSLIVWSFTGEPSKDLKGVDEGLLLLGKAEKTRSFFETETAFSGIRFSTDEELAIVDTTIEVKDKESLKLFFKADEDSDEPLAIVVGYAYGTGEKMQEIETDKRMCPEEAKKLFEFIKELEKQYN